MSEPDGGAKPRSAPFRTIEGLRTPRDLLCKLERDFQRIAANEADPDPAFDFFVTAHHLLDWLHTGDGRAASAEAAGSVLLRTCSHLANGAKHFELRDAKHDTVGRLQTEGSAAWAPGAWAPGAWSREAWAEPRIVVSLEGDAAAEFGPQIDAYSLAERVLAHWRADPRVGVTESDNG